MKIILLKDIRGVGRKDDVITATDGYSRNYLLPRKLGIEATKENLIKLQDKKNSIAHKKSLEIKSNKKIAEEISKVSLNLKVKAGANGKIFGGITSKEIAEELKKQHGIEIDKKKIVLKETIKVIGRFWVEIKFGDGVVAKLAVRVEPEL